MRSKMCVIGLGYIGFPTSLIFAKAGFEVVGVDTNEKIVSILQRGELHIEENGLGDIFELVKQHHSFRAATCPEEADVFMIAVPTPVNEDHTANLDYVVSATQSVIPYLKRGSVVIIESTIPPGTTEEVVGKMIRDAGWNVGEDIYLAHCPERVMPGQILRELIGNNRIVGGINPQSAEKAADIYRTFVMGEIVLTSSASAEMTKLMENTFRDVNIALANELAKLAQFIGADPLEIISLANKHPRVHLHQPGPGVGGHCIAVDPYFIIEKAPHLTPLMQISREINQSMPEFVIRQVERIVPAHADHKIAIFGVTYKGNIGDIRESPALDILNGLQSSGYRICVFDPHVESESAPFPLNTAVEAVRDATLLLVLSDHNEFKCLEEKWISLMKMPVVLDTKNCVTLQANSRGKLYTYGNLHELLKMEETLALAAAGVVE